MLDTNHSISTISTRSDERCCGIDLSGKFAKVHFCIMAGGIGYMVFKALPFLIAGTTNLLFFVENL